MTIEPNVEYPVVLADALQSGHAFVPSLVDAVERMITEVETRGILR